MAVCSKTGTQESKASFLTSTNSVSKLLLSAYQPKFGYGPHSNILRDHNASPVSPDLVVTKTISKG